MTTNETSAWLLEVDDYDGKLMPGAVRRLLQEQAGLSKEGLQEQGIYHKFDETHPHKAVAVIVGPNDTPYARGLYLFEFAFPNDYPLRPPRAIFRTTGDGRVRFNPNLYSNGKVCLSILGTWPGPSWVSSLSFRTVLLSLQSLFCHHPLQNEPGYEEAAGQDSELYSAILRYENLAVSAMQLARPLPDAFAPLRDTMAGLFLFNYHRYQHALEEFSNCEGLLDRCPLFSFVTRYRPGQLRHDLESLQEELRKEEEALRIADGFKRASANPVAAAGSRETELENLLPPPPHVPRGYLPTRPEMRRCLKCFLLAAAMAGVFVAIAALLVHLLPSNLS
eukprot:TRINITY_DN22886_c0_g1_i1.p1 TRINITY_DN22886_c0_g1~~TRINITY_DN22886_c0_g1_i1.p1  ORF type:complete len:335 (+),score=35.02 TRINITY_DN22886_c0_g1_i1:134-1138(+)